jgi:hypothetical protein
MDGGRGLFLDKIYWGFPMTKHISDLSRAAAIAIAVSGFAALAQPASAAVSQITSPDSAYTGGTTLLSFTDPDFTSINSLSDGTVTVSFGTSVEERTVPGDWATWGSPPDTEDSAPRILYTSGATSLTMDFSKVLSTFGFEAEPDNFAVENFTVEYFLGGVSQGSFSRDIDGSAGARLLAASGSFDSMVVTDNAGGDFAMAQLRYATGGGAVPEPAAWAMMLVGFGGIGATLRASRRRTAAVAA